MEIRKGIGVSAGVVVCAATVYSPDELRIGRRSIPVTEIARERNRLLEAITTSSDDIRTLRDATSRNLGKETGAIFDFHLGLLNDPELLKAFNEGIDKFHLTAEYAVHKALRDYGRIFLEHSDPLFRDRVKDIYDIERRLVHKLIGRERGRIADITEPSVLVAHDLTPSQMASLDKGRVRAIAIEAGGQTSHSAIIANSMGIPAVLGLENITHEVTTGDMMIVNGFSGLVIINPDEATIAEHRRYEERAHRYENSLAEIRDLPARTTDGVDITLLGNIEFPHEIANTLAKGAQGIGLYRTEFLYLACEKEPTEEDHYNAYMEVAKKMTGKPIVIRTLDLGADKYFLQGDQPKEDNPFLGCRSIRLCLGNMRMFKTQLRALLRASAHGDIRIMFPMISHVMELRQAKMMLKDVMEELDYECIDYNRSLQVGMMIEVPSAALMCHAYVHDVDFFSIGSNDLVQYTLAVDRGNQKVASLYTAAHPAVLSLIRTVIRQGLKGKIGVSLCGEMAGEKEFTVLLLGMGMRTLSIAPHNIPLIKKVIRSINLRDAQKIARKVMSFEHPQQVTSYLHDETRKLVPDIFAVESPTG